VRYKNHLAPASLPPNTFDNRFVDEVIV